MEIALTLIVVFGGIYAIRKWYFSKPRSFQVDGATYTRQPDGSFTTAAGVALAGVELARVQEAWSDRTNSGLDYDDRDYDTGSSND